MNRPLGRLVTVPVRDVWAHEAINFTPWLAEAENLAFLADALELGELQLQGTEVSVGSFYIDILARDIEDRIVLIENQFGSTDHNHLGQIMTYIAGQEGKATIVWIAEKFREEHRAAIDWLNASTVEGFDFFAVEVEALRIGDSAPAPWFNVVGKPNAWSRNVSRSTRTASDKPLDDRQKAYTAYWSAFAFFLEEKKAPFKVKVPLPRDYWCGFGLGRSGFRLVTEAVLRDRKLSTQIYIEHRASKAAFDALATDRATIEVEFGGPLEWQRMDDKKACRIAVYRNDLDPNDQAQRPIQHAWFLDQMGGLARAFGQRIKNLQLDTPNDVDSEPVG